MFNGKLFDVSMLVNLIEILGDLLIVSNVVLCEDEILGVMCIGMLLIFCDDYFFFLELF